MFNSQINSSQINDNQLSGTLEQSNKQESKRVEWIGSVILPLFITVASLVQFIIQDNQIKKSIITEYIDNISSLEDLELKEKEDQKNIQDIDELKEKQWKLLESQENIRLEDRLKFVTILNEEKDSLLAANNAKSIARAQTLAALRRLDGDGDSKGFIVLFLYESNLIKLQNSEDDKQTQSESNKQVSSGINLLSGADLRKVQLSNKDLWRVNLKGAILRNANLSDAILKDADLRNTDLKDANLRNADLRSADLTGSVLKSRELIDACYNDETKIDFNELKPDPRPHMRKVLPQEDKNFKCSK